MIDNLAPERCIAYAARDPNINAITVLIKEALKLLNRNPSASILSNSPPKFSTENTFGKKLGGTAITSDPGLKEQQITYM